MKRTIGEIAAELADLIDKENESHGLWDNAFEDATNPHAPFTRQELQQRTYKATQIHGEVVDRLEHIYAELTSQQYIDTKHRLQSAEQFEQEIREAEGRINLNRRRMERRLKA